MAAVHVDELTYVPDRRIDTRLAEFLEKSNEYHMVATLFMPPRTGKTTAVREAAKRKGWTLLRFYNSNLKGLAKKLTAAGNGTYSRYCEVTESCLNSSDLGIVSTEKRYLIHVDEANLFVEGIDTFRKDNSQFGFSDAPPAARLAALVHHIRMMCNENVRLVVSGTALDIAPMLSFAASDKCFRLWIDPTTPDFVKRVLSAQNPPLAVTDEQSRELVGHVGQLYWAYKTAANGQLQLEAAYRQWLDESKARLVWTMETAFNAAFFIQTLASADATGYIPIEQNLRSTPLYRKVCNDGAWVTVFLQDQAPYFAPLSPWQQRALDQMFFQVSSLLTQSFLTFGAAVANDVEKQKGYVFQLLFALELTRQESPLWGALKLSPLKFSRLCRFTADVEWERNVLYVVSESSQQKLGDIVFVTNDGEVCALELKCRTEENTWSEFLTYNELVGKQNKKVNHFFVSCIRVQRLDDPTNVPLTTKGKPDKRCKTPSTANVHVVNDACSLGTHFVLHPDLVRGTVLQFASTICRSESEASRVEDATANALLPDRKRPRPRAEEFIVSDKSAGVAFPVWVQQRHATGTGTAFKVTPVTNDIDSLKKAIKAELPKSVAEELMSSQITILESDGTEVTDPEQPLKANTEETPYLFKL